MIFYEFLRIKYFQTDGLIEKNIEFSNVNIDELLDIQHIQLSSRVERE